MGAPALDLGSRLAELMRSPGAPASLEQLRAAGEVRALLRWLVSAEAPDEVWKTLADGLAALRAALPPADTSTRYARPAARAGRIAQRSGFHPNLRETHPLVGRANPVAPPIEMHAEGARAIGDLVFGPAHEGIPGCAHGGHIAAGFDIVLGQAASLSSAGGGVTGTLTVRYLDLTPTGVALRYEAWLEREEGRKAFVRGRLSVLPGPGSDAAARVTAEAEGIFVQRAAAPPHKELP
jgi:acyl-coenzyme A thioesterase PaaI-like protein